MLVWDVGNKKDSEAMGSALIQLQYEEPSRHFKQNKNS